MKTYIEQVSVTWQTFVAMQESGNPLTNDELRSLAGNPHTSKGWKCILDAAIDYNNKRKEGK